MFSDIIFDYLKLNKIESGVDLGFKNEKLEKGILRDSYEIKTEKESLRYGKPQGLYELLSIPDVLEFWDDDIKYCSEVFADILKKMIGKINSTDRILIVGLGNRHISSDSLGAKVAGKINITIENNNLPKVMAFCPSVMGLTGMETVDIIEGVVSKVKPSHLIIIDSLCASSVERLGRSIQVTNTGICPGKGIGNNRKCIDKNIAPNVFSIGIPLLIYSSTFVEEALMKYNINLDLLNNIMQNIRKHPNLNLVYDLCDNLKDIINNDVDDIIVSIKDIEECVEILSIIVSKAINIALGVIE